MVCASPEPGQDEAMNKNLTDAPRMARGSLRPCGAAGLSLA
jgi:hypothetical protein